MSKENCPDAGQSPRAPEYCVLCAPSGRIVEFPRHGGETKREPGKCYCGKPLPPPTGETRPPYTRRDFLRPTSATEVMVARQQLDLLYEEVREWRHAAARLALSQGTGPQYFSTPAQFIESQLDGILHLIDKAQEYHRGQNEARELVRHLIGSPEGAKEWETVRDLARTKLGWDVAPVEVCGICRKPNPDSESRPVMFPDELRPEGNERVHALCQEKAQKAAFAAMAPQEREKFISKV